MSMHMLLGDSGIACRGRQRPSSSRAAVVELQVAGQGQRRAASNVAQLMGGYAPSPPPPAGQC